MYVIVEVEGLNLERLLRMAADEGLRLRSVHRTDSRKLCARISVSDQERLKTLCVRSGWEIRECRAGLLMRLSRFLCRRMMLIGGLLLCAAAVYISSGMVLCIQVEGASRVEAAVRGELSQAGIRLFYPKNNVSTDKIRAALELALPDLAFAGVRFLGSTLVVDCYPAVQGEKHMLPGAAMDIVAMRPGIVTAIYAVSGTPLVSPGDAVYTGQILIKGEEAGEKQSIRRIQAQGHVRARVWERGEARVSLWEDQLVGTGRFRRRVILNSPWYERVVVDAQAFDSQIVTCEQQPLAGLYLPFTRRIETLEEVAIQRSKRSEAEASAMAMAAAEEFAKNKCPANAHILDKFEEYCMIENEFVCAAVVLEYEQDIAVRP